MSEIIPLLLIITSTVTFIASAVLMFYNQKIGLPIGEWVIFIFISFVISASQIAMQLNPNLVINPSFLLITISIAIFALVVKSFWELFTEYSF